MPLVTDPTKIDEWLREGVPVATIMNRSSWGRSQVKSRAMRMRLLIDPRTDKAYSLEDSGPDVDEQEDEIHEQVTRVRESAVPSTLKGVPPIQPGRIDALLAAAEGSRVARLSSRAARIRLRVEELAEAMRGEQERIKARKEIETLERRLSELRARARQRKSGGPYPDLTPEQIEVRRANGRRPYERLNAVCERFNVTPAMVRAWAQENGLDVPVTGPIKGAACDAFEKAHSPEEAAS